MMEEKMTALREKISANAEVTEAALREACPVADEDLQSLFDAETYSLLGGGKRIRPFLVNAFCEALGGDTRVSMPFACALEMIHTYSLIHDDLPCMDDDDMRRGKPSNHKVFGYATALLAGDALLTRAFLTASSNPYADRGIRSDAVRLIAEAAGDCGMIGGQIIDLAGENETLAFDKLLRLHTLKTGALIRCAARLGCLAAGYAEGTAETEAATVYAEKIGLAFQVIDDILDAVGSEEELGKSVGGDADHHKTTFLTYFDVEGARKYAEELTADAIRSIASWERSETLETLAIYLLERTY
ncbi:MAG: polyprenyl synthetase family protein [Clostridia bacterium]|nr:polyprenyl synthetase family protein [Clostridia bacterium]